MLDDSKKTKTELLKELALLKKDNQDLERKLTSLKKENGDDEHLLLLNTIKTHIFYLSDPETYGFVNKAYADFLGVETCDLAFKKLKDVLSAEEALKHIAFNKNIFAKKKQTITEELLQRADGEERLVAFTKTPKINDAGKVEYVICTGEDITEKKHAERLLAFTQFTINQAKIAVFWCHADGRFFYVNKTGCEWLMYDFDELKQMHFADINPQFPQESWEEHWLDIKTKGMVDMESFHQRKNGDIFPVELHAKYFQFEGEEYKLSFVHDISDKVQARADLKSSQHFLENILESIQDGVCVLDRDFNIIHTNAVMKDWYSNQGNLLGRKCYEAFHSYHKACCPCPTKKALLSGNTESEIIPGIEGGKAEWLEVFSYPLRDLLTHEITGVVEFIRDITDRIRLEKQLSQAQKMKAISTLSNGIAHDFTNILQAILGSIQLLLVQKDSNHPDRKFLTTIEGAVERAQELTSRLLYLGRTIKSNLQPVDMNNELRNLVKLLERSLPKMVSIKVEHGKNLKTIKADIIQVEQIILNLAINASHAMPDGGELTLQTENIYVDDIHASTNQDLHIGNYVTLTVSDTGIGMDQVTLSRIYEPYFTTKNFDQGSGLGLSMVYGIVKSHGGIISCYSIMGVGTTFRIYFPSIEHSSEVNERTNLEHEAKVLGTETILFVDDEQEIMEIGCILLEKYGYATRQATSGEEALEIVKMLPGKIDLLILDLNMPGMGGYKCLIELKQLYPEIKVIVVSGFATHSNTESVLEAGAQAFLPKPYQSRELLSTLRNILDDKQTNQ